MLKTTNVPTLNQTCSAISNICYTFKLTQKLVAGSAYLLSSGYLIFYLKNKIKLQDVFLLHGQKGMSDFFLKNSLIFNVYFV